MTDLTSAMIQVGDTNAGLKFVSQTENLKFLKIWILHGVLPTVVTLLTWPQSLSSLLSGITKKVIQNDDQRNDRGMTQHYTIIDDMK